MKCLSIPNRVHSAVLILDLQSRPSETWSNCRHTLLTVRFSDACTPNEMYLTSC